MIETHMQYQQQDIISQQPAYPDPQTEKVALTNPAIACSICEAVYAPAPQQTPFLQYEQGALEATFMGICHFCFRCRHAACPQCWDEMHGVCGACVQEAGLPFRETATPLDGLVFPPAVQAFIAPSQEQNGSLFVLVRNGRFHRETQAQPESVSVDTTTEHTPAITSTIAETGTPASQTENAQPDDRDRSIPASTAATKTGKNATSNKDHIDTPAAVAIPIKKPASKGSQKTKRQKKTPCIAKKAKQVSRLEQILTWVVLVIVLALVVVITLAEFIPAVNTAIAHTTHIDIRGEIAYLVHAIQQIFKR